MEEQIHTKELIVNNTEKIEPLLAEWNSGQF